MNQYLDKIDSFLEENEANIIRDLQTLVRIKSVSEPDSGVKPYGQGCRDVLDQALKMGAEMGFDTRNYEYYCGSISYGHQEKDIAFWSHLDVVPEGDGWSTPPYEAVYRDGFVIGRGTGDNKSAAVMALYLMKFFQENQIPLRYQLKLMLGCNEEKGMEDTAYYLAHYKPATLSLIVDTAFPVCYGEKGVYEADIQFPALGNLMSFDAGLASNIVPAKAEVRVKNTKGISQLPQDQWVTASVEGDEIVLEASGVSAHAASPEGSQNAIASAVNYLLSNGLLEESLVPMFTFIQHATNTCHGEAYGIEFEDEVSGVLTCNTGMLHMKDGVLTLNMNIRYPITDDAEKITASIREAALGAGGKLVAVDDNKPNYFDKNHPAVTLLTQIYNDCTGDNKEPYTMGGGTYARKIPNAIAFGPGLAGPTLEMPAGHGGGHQPDEYQSIEKMKKALKIYIISIFKLNELDL